MQSPAVLSDRRILAGSDVPLGATWDGTGTNFALFSAHAEKVELCLFDSRGKREIERIELPEFTHQVWHGYLPDVRPGQLYGYRVHGPYAPEAGHRFNPNKLLLDPYALQHRGNLRSHPALFGYRMGHEKKDLSFDRRDSAFVMPKCMVVDTAHTWGNDVRPEIPWAKTIVYEAHVGGMTMGNDEVEPHLRGTFEGLADPRVIDHLVKLGVTSLELLPVQAFYDEGHLADKGLVNWWGYATLGFFAPAQRYLSPNESLHEFKLMVRRLHEAGIEVIMDVVYNHTSEGSEQGPTLSFRGIDNASYYTLADDPRYYFDTTGTGNSLNMKNSRVLQMVMDSLRYWVEECHVDGFRFDLASTLGRDRDSFSQHAVFLEATRQDPVLANVKLIAEPWDTGANGYQVGNFPPGWAEWNDQYRDNTRAFWKGDDGLLPKLANGMLGSADTFSHDGRRPWASVNFITAHDGFTLMDLVSYNEKHNEANGEDNRDGHSHNLSWNCGVEGPTDDPEIIALRDRQRRNMMTTLLLSQGTPMILMGDERGRSQDGNNNTYCQPGEMNWLDWSPDERQQAFEEFVRRVLEIRNTRGLFLAERYLHSGPDARGNRYARWLRPDGTPMEPGDWDNGLSKAVGLMLHQRGTNVYLMLNASHEDVPFTVPEPKVGPWARLIDTAEGVADPTDAPVVDSSNLTLGPRSMIVLEAPADD
ncbi:glycogen debranching protein GlgX [Wenxinia marina]|uniref:Glycogen debranching enzyme GlgX n=1 Tax=Wenxinia marina DSM 24838 TaxID=1123501 RepID=A0A0D0QG71_9RHOB|nr:glycogen debranching protein GlgX [Wenxinia marina]KIQ70038.1 glycogen debranching enzyme GlgX [Wenxinia marina DSM 24838]GGL63044.1 glycogen operon protein GlgX homolog [Wenxinia marina]